MGCWASGAGAQFRKHGTNIRRVSGGVGWSAVLGIQRTRTSAEAGGWEEASAGRRRSSMPRFTEN